VRQLLKMARRYAEIVTVQLHSFRWGCSIKYIKLQTPLLTLFWGVGGSWDRVLPSGPGWPQIHNPPASTSLHLLSTRDGSMHSSFWNFAHAIPSTWNIHLFLSPHPYLPAKLYLCFRSYFLCKAIVLQCASIASFSPLLSTHHTLYGFVYVKLFALWGQGQSTSCS
jgi:hypothetical protein